MNEEKQKSILRKSWVGWRGLGSWFIVFFIAAFVLFLCIGSASFKLPTFSQLTGFAFLRGLICAVLITLLIVFLRWIFHWRNLKRFLFGLTCLITLIALFYAEENWRGKRAWENCKRELEAKGEVLDWNKFIPSPVPDDQNFFAAPKMAEWFVGRGGTDLSRRLQNDKTTPVVGEDSKIKTETDAKNYLAWSDQFEPDFELIRGALKRPYARADGDYSQPYQIPVPNFITVRAVAQVLAQRAHCYLLLNQPEKALDELTLLNESRRIMEHAPAGKPITLVDAMINVAVTGLYADTIADGFRKRAWQEPQLAALQNQLEQIDLLSIVAGAFESEPAATTHTLEITSAKKLTKLFSQIDSKQWKWSLWPLIKSALIPRGWIYQNMVWIARLGNEEGQGFNSTSDLIRPKKFDDLLQRMNNDVFFGNSKPYNFLAAAAIPNFTKAWQVAAHNQTLVNEAQVACALERYRIANGNYPETLDTLAPKFIEKIPHDIIGGEQLIYRRANGGKFLLYSIGWNEKDDGGADSSEIKNASSQYAEGDWVWKN
ncbi:MAG TPA: hypothetical protein VHG71_12755 [Verrucomicrobiae bacterium]|nr:hypothetical protein [Verrucomicrobiae bacterium]